MARLFPALLVCGLVLMPSPAAAQRTNAPPGNSGVDEYLEVIPGGGGGRPSTGPGKTGRDPLSPSARRKLAAEGPAGKAAAAVAERTGADAGASRPRSGAGDRARGESAPAAAFKRAAGGSESAGMGAVLPAILAAVAVVAAAAGVIRRRRAS